MKTHKAVRLATGQRFRKNAARRGCGKVAYSSKKHAKGAAARQSIETGETIKAYKCTRGCHAWHIGHPPGTRREPLPGMEPPRPSTVGEHLIRRERMRQITDEKYTRDHDDAHMSGELTTAARCYELYALQLIGDDSQLGIVEWWPWGHDSWKPTSDPVRMFVKAGALYEAEADKARRGTDWVNASLLYGYAKACAAHIDELVAKKT